jgi:hypothetical protein
MKNILRNLTSALFFFTVIYGFPFYTHADVDRWQYVASSDEYSFYYDNSAVSYGSWFVAVWVKAVPKVKVEIEGRDVTYVLKHWAFYSGERKFKELETVYYFTSSTSKHGGSDKKAVNPGTIVDELYERFCEKSGLD